MKKQLFFENVKLLVEKFGIVPLMYGSLGLEYITGKSFCADDIDILVPKEFVSSRWGEFKSGLEKAGYLLFDEHEHTFLKNGVCYSYASIEELETFAKISLKEIKNVSEGGANFKILSPEQYLEVYKASSKDGYRINVRQKKDDEKIAFLKEYLKNH